MTDNTALLSSLNLFTLVAVFLILVFSFLYFLRRKKNRVAASHALGLDDDKTSGGRPLT